MLGYYIIKASAEKSQQKSSFHLGAGEEQSPLNKNLRGSERPNRKERKEREHCDSDSVHPVPRALLLINIQVAWKKDFRRREGVDRMSREW